MAFIRNLSTAYVIAAVCALAAGCAETPSDEISTLAASATTTAETGVATWGTYEDSDGRWVIGLGSDGTKLGALRAAQIDDDALQFVGQPGLEQVVLSRDGTLTGGEGSLARRLVAALYADTRTAWFSRPGEPAAASTGTATQALTSLNSQQDFTCNGLFGGLCGEFDAGWGCGGAYRLYYDAYPVGGAGSCWIVRWLSDDPTDCRIRVHTATSWFGSVTCRTLTYVDR